MAAYLLKNGVVLTLVPVFGFLGFGLSVAALSHDSSALRDGYSRHQPR